MKTIHQLIDDTLVLMSSLVDTAPLRQIPEIDRLFHALLSTDSAQLRGEAEDLIWTLWCAHGDDAASEAMEDAVNAIASQELERAERILDALVDRCPEWSEAWNKRATLYFLLSRDRESVLDIQETLRREPRHFGAVSGLGQICLRAGERTSALYVLEYALRLNPGLSSVRTVVEALRTEQPGVLH